MNNSTDTNSIFYDPNSRYNNIDNNAIVFLTPNEIKELDVGMDLSDYKESEMDTRFPFLLDSLKEMVKETTMGEDNGSVISFPVENSDCNVFIAIEINGKLCKLQNEEWDWMNNLCGLPTHKQVKLFQRLISIGEITLNDLEKMDIDNSVYKKLVVNDICGCHIKQEKLHYLDKVYKKQKKDKKLSAIRDKIIGNL